jgi:hypothetical protein
MKGKFVSALVGIGTAAMFVIPGAASASTAVHATPGKADWAPGNSCWQQPVPWRLEGRYRWVQEGWGWNSRCVLVPIWGGGHGGGGQGGGGHGHGGRGR